MKFLSRTIEKALRNKVQEASKRFIMAGCLAESVLKNRRKKMKGVHRAVFQWINSNEGETIEMEYETWPAEDKHDHFTFAESY